MPSSTPNLVYYTRGKRDEVERCSSVERALHLAAENAFVEGKTTSVYVFPRSAREHPGDLPEGHPVSVINVKVTASAWE